MCKQRYNECLSRLQNFYVSLWRQICILLSSVSPTPAPAWAWQHSIPVHFQAALNSSALPSSTQFQCTSRQHSIPVHFQAALNSSALPGSTQNKSNYTLNKQTKTQKVSYRRRISRYVRHYLTHNLAANILHDCQFHCFNECTSADGLWNQIFADLLFHS